MDFQAEYRSKLRTPAEAVRAVKNGDWVDYTSGLGFPPLLDAALAARRDELHDVKVRGNLCAGPVQIVECDPEQAHFLYHTWHCSAYERRLCDRGLCYFTPMIFRNLAWYYREFLTVNVAMASVAPMDRHGYFNLSAVTGVSRAILDRADIVILEVNERTRRSPTCPRTRPRRRTPPSQTSSCRTSATGRPSSSASAACPPCSASCWPGPACMTSACTRSCARTPTSTCTRPACSRTAAARSTAGRGCSASCSGRSGCMTGSTITPASSRRRCRMSTRRRPSRSWTTWCPSTAASRPISTGLRQISGTGGQLDFLTGAAMARGGKAFICMTSTFTDKQGVRHSRILPHFGGDIVTSPRSQAYYLATEYGVVNLAGRSTWERAEALVSIAHPDFREQLIAAAESQKIWRRSARR